MVTAASIYLDLTSAMEYVWSFTRYESHNLGSGIPMQAMALTKSTTAPKYWAQRNAVLSYNPSGRLAHKAKGGTRGGV